MMSISDPIRHPASKRQRVQRAAFFWVSVAILFLLLQAVYVGFGIGIPCPINTLTGLLCPGCGMFRATGAVLRVDIWQAIRYNALSVILMPLLLALGIRETARYIRAIAPKKASRLEMIFSVGVAVISLLYAIARNLPWLAMLRPTVL